MPEAVSSQRSAINGGGMQDFRHLKVWEKAHRMTLDIFQATRKFPRQELYGLSSQIRRACMSIPANISEGCGRRGDRDFARFLQIAMASACETEYYLILARDLGFLEPPLYVKLTSQVTEVKRMLVSLLVKLRAEG